MTTTTAVTTTKSNDGSMTFTVTAEPSPSDVTEDMILCLLASAERCIYANGSIAFINGGRFASDITVYNGRGKNKGTRLIGLNWEQRAKNKRNPYTGERVPGWFNHRRQSFPLTASGVRQALALGFEKAWENRETEEDR